eukprot:m.30826 g.30826  ORF g.30826 m.30826 type:complete len:380 (+) comp6256_c0_seq1:1160-2299(+)
MLGGRVLLSCLQGRSVVSWRSKHNNPLLRFGLRQASLLTTKEFVGHGLVDEPLLSSKLVPHEDAVPTLVSTKRCPISQFGTLLIQADCARVEVASLHPGYHPETAPSDLNDRTEAFFEIINLDGRSSIVEEEDVLINIWEAEKQVEMQAANKNLLVKAWVPFSCDIDARGVAQLILKNMEGGSLMYCGQGDCFISQSKLRSFNVMTDGNIVGDKLQGNVNFDSMNGGIHIGKLQSEEVILRTHHANPVSVEVLLSNTTLISSEDGNVSIGHFHGDVNIDTNNGNIEIGSGDGSLSAVSEGNGRIRTHVAATTTVNMLHSSDENIVFTVDESDIPPPTTVDGFVAKKTPFMEAWAFKGDVVKRIRQLRPHIPSLNVTPVF